MEHTLSEENYLKAIYALSGGKEKGAATNAIARQLEARASSVTDMLQKLAGKGLISYRKYHGVRLTGSGKSEALKIVRKHRLWESFLVDTLKFRWDEVHEIAEQLEHIRSEKFIDRIDRFLHFPRFDPHGDPIPDKKGRIREAKTTPLSELKPGNRAVMAGVADHSKGFLKHLDKMGINPGCGLIVKEILEWDKSLKISAGGSKKIFFISHDVAKNILVIKNGKRKNKAKVA